MRYHELSQLNEKRRNADQNTREDVVAFLAKYKDNPKAYLHTTMVEKVGIYPRSSWSHDTPVGIFAFRVADVFDEYIARWNNDQYQKGISFLPYYGGEHVFILESDIEPDFPGTYTEEDLARDSAKLQELFHLTDADIKQLKYTASTNLNFRDCPAGYFWGMTKALVAGVREFDQYTPTNPKRWNAVLRKLGYVGFNDPGMGVLHGAEDTQACFLTASAFRVIDHMKHRRQQKVTTIGDQKYKGGRVPRDLHMKGIPNTLFYNAEPADFSKVRRWTIDHVRDLDLSSFYRFLPWNAQGIIGMLGTEFRSSYDAEKFFAQSVPSRVHIKSVYIGGRDVTLILRRIPIDYPVDEIIISRYANTYGIDKLPPEIQAKIKAR